MATSPGGAPSISPLTTLFAISRPVNLSFPTTLRTKARSRWCVESASCSVTYRAAARRHSTTKATPQCEPGRLDCDPSPEYAAPAIRTIVDQGPPLLPPFVLLLPDKILKSEFQILTGFITSRRNICVACFLFYLSPRETALKQAWLDREPARDKDLRRLRNNLGGFDDRRHLYHRRRRHHPSSSAKSSWPVTWPASRPASQAPSHRPLSRQVRDFYCELIIILYRLA